MQLLLILLSSIRPYSSVDKELLSLIHQGFSARKFSFSCATKSIMQRNSDPKIEANPWNQCWVEELQAKCVFAIVQRLCVCCFFENVSTNVARDYGSFFLKNFSTFLRSYLRISSFAPSNLFFKPLIVSAATAFKMFGIVTFKFHRKISYSYRAWNEIAILYSRRLY